MSNELDCSYIHDNWGLKDEPPSGTMIVIFRNGSAVGNITVETQVCRWRVSFGGGLLNGTSTNYAEAREMAADQFSAVVDRLGMTVAIGSVVPTELQPTAAGLRAAVDTMSHPDSVTAFMTSPRSQVILKRMLVEDRRATGRYAVERITKLAGGLIEVEESNEAA